MIRAFQWDLARQAERLDWLIGILPRYADWGYGELYLHLEDALQYPSLPGVARADAYTFAELEALVAAAGRVGIRVVPIVNLLGHTDYLIRVPEFRDLNELRDDDGAPLARGQVCPLHPRLPEVARALMRDVRPLCTAGKIHVGLDESFHLGRHPLSRAEIAAVGLAEHFARHVRRLHALAGAEGLRLGIWADMLALVPEAIPLLPAGIAAYDWYYYPFDRHPRLELRNFAPYDLAGPLRRQGIGYWGCPMDGAFRFEPLPVFGERIANLRSWWGRCASTGAEGFLVTGWEPNRLALEMTTVVDAAAASLWLDAGVDDAPGMLARGFERVFGPRRPIRSTAARGRRQPGATPGTAAPGEAARTWARAALACDERAFAGYARWEINDRWDVCLTRGGAAPYRGSLAFHERLVRRADGYPAPFKASLRFGRYLACRDVFVRRSGAGVLSLRRLAIRHGSAHPRFRAALAALAREAGIFAREIAAGRAAARILWRRTRTAATEGPNERILRADEARLKDLRSWLRRVDRAGAGPGAKQSGDTGRASDAAGAGHPLFAAGPLCGAWQLRFAVVLTEPALQKVIVERQAGENAGPRDESAAWETLHGRFTIEFRAAAARRKAAIRREFSTPVGGPGDRLRIAVRGLGRVTLTDVELTDGLTVLRPRGWPARVRRQIGERAPEQGFPVLDWERNTGAVELRWP